jgi:hypothetical protein
MLNVIEISIIKEVNNDHDSRGGKAKVQYDSEIKYSFLTLE